MTLAETYGPYLEAMRFASEAAKAEGRRGRLWRSRYRRNLAARVTYHRTLLASLGVSGERPGRAV